MVSTLGIDSLRLVRDWRSVLDQRLDALGLKAHWVTLFHVCHLPPGQSQIQLAKAIGIDQPSLVKTLDQLEKKNLIIRRSCVNDRRTKKIYLTASSTPLIKEMNDMITGSCQEILAGLSQQEIVLLAQLITKIEKNILRLQQEEPDNKEL